MKKCTLKIIVQWKKYNDPQYLDHNLIILRDNSPIIGGNISQVKKWSSMQKLEIVLVAIKGDMTMNDICQYYQVAPSRVHAWKKQLLESGATIFENKSESKKKKSEAQKAQVEHQLYEKIGQLTVERDFLKKAWKKYSGGGGGGDRRKLIDTKSSLRTCLHS